VWRRLRMRRMVKSTIVTWYLVLPGLVCSSRVQSAQILDVDLFPRKDIVCAGEVLILDATITNVAGRDLEIGLATSDFIFTPIHSSSGLAWATLRFEWDRPWEGEYLRAIGGLSLKSGESESFLLPFPLTAVGWRARGTPVPRLEPGEYTIQWQTSSIGISPNPELVEDQGKFAITVLPMDKDCVLRAYQEGVEFALDAYSGELPRFQRWNRHEVARYLLECMTEAFAVPLLKPLLERDNASLRRLALRPLLRIGNESALEVVNQHRQSPLCEPHADLIRKYTTEKSPPPIGVDW
jgi:hypothetical protein